MSVSPLSFERPGALSWDFPRDAAGLGVLIDVGREHGVSDTALLAGSGIAPDDLADGERLVTARQELRVVRNLRSAVPGLSGVEVGARYRAETFGVLGFALLSSRTLVEAANLALRFIDLSHTFAIPTPRLEGDVVVVEFDDQALPDDVAGFLVARDLTAVWKVLDQLRPGGFPLKRVTLRSPVGERAPHREVLGAPVVGGAAANSMSFEAAHLDTRLPGGGGARTLSESMCADLVSRRRARAGLAQEVRVVIAQQLGQGASMTAVAAALGVGERSLRRRLRAEGTSFQALLDEVRETLALQLLDTGLLSVEDIALRLGYAEASTFIVAFRRWRGTTPTAYAGTIRRP